MNSVLPEQRWTGARPLGPFIAFAIGVAPGNQNALLPIAFALAGLGFVMLFVVIRDLFRWNKTDKGIKDPASNITLPQRLEAPPSRYEIVSAFRRMKRGLMGNPTPGHAHRHEL